MTRTGTTQHEWRIFGVGAPVVCRCCGVRWVTWRIEGREPCNGAGE